MLGSPRILQSSAQSEPQVREWMHKTNYRCARYSYLILASILQSRFDALAGALVILARNSRADRAFPVQGENRTTMRDIWFNFIPEI